MFDAELTHKYQMLCKYVMVILSFHYSKDSYFHLVEWKRETRVTILKESILDNNFGCHGTQPKDTQLKWH